MTPRGDPRSHLGRGRHGGAGSAGHRQLQVFVDRVGDSRALGGHPAMTEGIRTTPVRWVSPLGAAGGTEGCKQPLPQPVAPRSGPELRKSPSSRNHGSRQTLAGSPLNVTNTV